MSRGNCTVIRGDSKDIQTRILKQMTGIYTVTAMTLGLSGTLGSRGLKALGENGIVTKQNMRTTDFTQKSQKSQRVEKLISTKCVVCQRLLPMPILSYLPPALKNILKKNIFDPK